MDGIKLNQQHQEEYQLVETRGICLNQCTLKHGEEKKMNEPEGRIGLIPRRMMWTCVGENADVCVGGSVCFVFVLYLISRGEFPSSHPDHFEVQTTMNGNLP